MNVKLITQGTPREQVIAVSKSRTVIGRQEGCALRIPSGDVSRRHCVLVCEDGHVTIEDLGSSNGTFLNGKKITAKRLVHPGDTLQVGPVTLAVEYSLADTNVQGAAAAASGKKPAAHAGQEAAATRHAADSPTDTHPVLKEKEEAVEGVLVDEDDDVVDAKLAGDDATKPWNIPEDQELRDILSQLEE